MTPAAQDWLVIDVGNTRTKWGIGDAGSWHTTGAVPTADLRALEHSIPALPGGLRAVSCTVAGDDAERAVAAACQSRGLTWQAIKSAAGLLGLHNGYEQPDQLGPDRWAALIGAHAEQPCDQLVVAAGTALTIDALRADGRFLGGIIVPGLSLMREALRGGTARLRPADGRMTAFPRNTDDAIASGTLMAACGAVDRMQEAMRLEAVPPARIVLTGGAARDLAPWLAPSPELREHLVFDGLARIARTLPWPA